MTMQTRRSDAILERMTTLHPKIIDLTLGRVERLLAALEGRRVDVVTLTSSSTVRHLLRAVPQRLLEGVKLASIGPVTSTTARDAGLEITVEAREYTVEGLAEAMADSQRGQAARS